MADPTGTTVSGGRSGAAAAQAAVAGGNGGSPRFSVLYHKDNVFVHPSSRYSSYIGGRLSLLYSNPEAEESEANASTSSPASDAPVAPPAPSALSINTAGKSGGDGGGGSGAVVDDLMRDLAHVFISWNPYDQYYTEGGGGGGEGEGGEAEALAAQYSFGVPMKDVAAIHRHTPRLQWPFIIISLHDGVSFPPLYFHSGGVRELFTVMVRHVALVRSPEDPNCYCVGSHGQSLLERSLTGLSLVMEDDTASPRAEVASRVSRGWGILEAFSHVTAFAAKAVSGGGAAKPKPLPFGEDPIETVAAGPAVVPVEMLEPADDGVGAGSGDPDAAASGDGDNPEADSSETPPPATDSVADDNDGFELIDSEDFEDMPAALGTQTPAGAAEAASAAAEAEAQAAAEAAARAKAKAALPAIPAPHREAPLSADEWTESFDSAGICTRSAWIKERVFFGGVSEEIRVLVWPFLLGLFPWQSTAAERRHIRTIKEEEYKGLKMQWQSISYQQGLRCSLFVENYHRIEKDVVRTDRGSPFFEGDDNPHLTQLRDILLSYCQYNFDLGYVQGMSDMVAPLLMVVQDEAFAFWLFAAWMERKQRNFDRDQVGIHTQLSALAEMQRLLDAELYDYLETIDALNFFFAFRWVLITFKREFPLDDVMRLWEVLWADHWTPHFHLFVCLALLAKQKEAIMENSLEFDETLRLINGLAMGIDLESLVLDAETVYRTLTLRAGSETEHILHTIPVAPVEVHLPAEPFRLP